MPVRVAMSLTTASSTLRSVPVRNPEVAATMSSLMDQSDPDSTYYGLVVPAYQPPRPRSMD